jgi:hypothetical protein
MGVGMGVGVGVIVSVLVSKVGVWRYSYRLSFSPPSPSHLSWLLSAGCFLLAAGCFLLAAGC